MTMTEQQIAALIKAAELALETFANMSTEQFAQGHDRKARRALAKALGKNPDDYSL